MSSTTMNLGAWKARPITPAGITKGTADATPRPLDLPAWHAPSDAPPGCALTDVVVVENLGSGSIMLAPWPKSEPLPRHHPTHGRWTVKAGQSLSIEGEVDPAAQLLVWAEFGQTELRCWRSFSIVPEA
jgi:hypothetical protein